MFTGERKKKSTHQLQGLHRRDFHTSSQRNTFVHTVRHVLAALPLWERIPRGGCILVNLLIHSVSVSLISLFCSKLYTLDPDKLRTAAVEVDSNTMKQKLQNIKSLVSARETPVHFSPRIQPTIPPPVALPHSHSTMLHKTTVYTSSPLTTVTVEKRKQGNRSRPVVIINLLQNAMLSDGPPPPLPRPFVTHTPKPPPLIKNHNTSNQSSTCTCSCGRDSNVNGIDENYVLTSDVVALLKTKSEILRSANGRLLSARWRHSLNSKQTLPPVNDNTVHDEVKIKQLQTQPKSDSSSDSERAEAAADQCPTKEPPLPCSLSVPKLSPISVVKGSALPSPQRLVDKFRSSLPNIPMQKCQQKRIDIDQFEAAEKFTAPVRNCLSAKVGREGTGSQHTKARVDARRHRCMQKLSHRRVTATNWQNFTAEEIDMSSALTWRPTYTLK